ncbi:MAG: glycosyltransferase family 39 protein, partial [Chloroflexota bacterium]
MSSVNALQRRDWLVLVTVLIIAALLRLGEPGIVEFKHDEAMLSLMAQDMVSGKGIPFTGIPSSVGVPNPPISVYLLALPYALSSNPLFATMFIAALNVLGVGLLWWIAHRYIGRTAAILAALIYAVNPWAILYSRKIWAQ